MSRNKSKRHHSRLRLVSKEARRAGMFLLCERFRWEFLSARTGRTVLTWFQDSGRWTIPGGRTGEARSPFWALHAAIAADRGRQQEAMAATL